MSLTWESADHCECVLSVRGGYTCRYCQKRQMAWENDRAKWQARYDLSRKHPELYPAELDEMMAGWEPSWEKPPAKVPFGTAKRPQRPPETNDLDPF